MSPDLRWLGVADDAVFAADAMAVVWVWDKDGLSSRPALQRSSDTDAQDGNSMYIEMQSANVVSRGRKTYLVADNYTRRFRSTQMKCRARRRFNAAAVNASARAGPYWPDPASSMVETADREAVPVAQYLPAHPGQSPMKINGDFDGREGWHGFSDGTKVGEMLVLLDGERLATVRALYDEQRNGSSATACARPTVRSMRAPNCRSAGSPAAPIWTRRSARTGRSLSARTCATATSACCWRRRGQLGNRSTSGPRRKGGRIRE